MIYELRRSAHPTTGQAEQKLASLKQDAERPERHEEDAEAFDKALKAFRRGCRSLTSRLDAHAPADAAGRHRAQWPNDPRDRGADRGPEEGIARRAGTRGAATRSRRASTSTIVACLRQTLRRPMIVKNFEDTSWCHRPIVDGEDQCLMDYTAPPPLTPSSPPHRQGLRHLRPAAPRIERGLYKGSNDCSTDQGGLYGRAVLGLYVRLRRALRRSDRGRADRAAFEAVSGCQEELEGVSPPREVFRAYDAIAEGAAASRSSRRAEGCRERPSSRGEGVLRGRLKADVRRAPEAGYAAIDAVRPWRPPMRTCSTRRTSGRVEELHAAWAPATTRQASGSSSSRATSRVRRAADRTGREKKHR